jgi:preprotein translocase subunit YajC
MQMLAIAAYAMIIGFFLVFAGMVFLLAYPSSQSEQASSNPAECKQRQDSETATDFIDDALIVALFLLIGVLAFVVARADAKEKAKRDSV